MTENGKNGGNGKPPRVPWGALETGPALAGLSRWELVVLTALLSFQGQGAACSPWRKAICERAGYPMTRSNLSKVSSTVQSLRNKGRIRVWKGGPGQPSMYQVLHFPVPPGPDVAGVEVPEKGMSRAEEVPVSGTQEVPDSGAKIYPNRDPSGSCFGNPFNKLQQKPTSFNDEQKDHLLHQPVTGKGDGPASDLTLPEAVAAFLRQRPKAERRAVLALLNRSVSVNGPAPVDSCLDELGRSLFAGSEVGNAVAYFGTVLARHVAAWRQERAEAAAREAAAEERRLADAENAAESSVAQARSAALRAAFDGLGNRVRDEVVAVALARARERSSPPAANYLRKQAALGDLDPFSLWMDGQVEAVMRERGLLVEGRAPPAAVTA